MTDEINLNTRDNLNPNIKTFSGLPEDKKLDFINEWRKKNKSDKPRNYNNYLLVLGAISLMVIAGLLGYTYYKNDGELFPKAVCAPVIPSCPTCPEIPACPAIPACPTCPGCSLSCGNVTINSTVPNINVSVFPNINVNLNSS
jgi:hypothetical protein